MTDGPSFNCSKSGISNCGIPAAEDDNSKDDKNEEKQAAMAPRGCCRSTMSGMTLPCFQERFRVEYQADRGVTELYFVVRLESRFHGAHNVLHPGSLLTTGSSKGYALKMAHAIAACNLIR